MHRYIHSARRVGFLEFKWSYVVDYNGARHVKESHEILPDCVRGIYARFLKAQKLKSKSSWNNETRKGLWLECGTKRRLTCNSLRYRYQQFQS